MLIRFRETFALPLEEVFSFFETPRDWARLYGFAGEIRDRGDGWVEVPLKSFPFPLVAKSTDVERNRRVRWIFRGFWKGEGEVRFSGGEEEVTLEGFERISIRWLGPLSPFVERRFLQRRFEAVWEYGWRRLRKLEDGRPSARATPEVGSQPRADLEDDEEEEIRSLRFDVFGRELLVEGRDDGWRAFYLGEGKRRPARDVEIPSTVDEEDLEEYLADLLHEFATSARPGVRRLD